MRLEVQLTVHRVGKPRHACQQSGTSSVIPQALHHQMMMSCWWFDPTCTGHSWSYCRRFQRCTNCEKAFPALVVPAGLLVCSRGQKFLRNWGMPKSFLQFLAAYDCDTQPVFLHDTMAPGLLRHKDFSGLRSLLARAAAAIQSLGSCVWQRGCWCSDRMMLSFGAQCQSWYCIFVQTCVRQKVLGEREVLHAQAHHCAPVFKGSLA